MVLKGISGILPKESTRGIEAWRIRRREDRAKFGLRYMKKMIYDMIEMRWTCRGISSKLWCSTLRCNGKNIKSPKSMSFRRGHVDDRPNKCFGGKGMHDGEYAREMVSESDLTDDKDSFKIAYNAFLHYSFHSG